MERRPLICVPAQGMKSYKKFLLFRAKNQIVICISLPALAIE